MKRSNVMMVVKSYDDVIKFGKFSGKTVAQVALIEPSYLSWLNDEGIVKFPKDMIDAIQWDILEDSRNEYGDSWGWDGDVAD
jgi:hypothetical protein